MYSLYLFNKRGGKVVKHLESAGGFGMLGMYALRGVTGGRVGLIVDEANEIQRLYIGRKGGCPKIVYLDKMGKLDYLELYLKDETSIFVNDLIEKYNEV